MSITPITRENLPEWARLHALLFPELTLEESLAECEDWFSAEPSSANWPKEMGVLYEKDGKYIGFVNISVRNDYVNGTDTSPVVFIEGIYVLPEYRSLGIGRELLEYAESFAIEKDISQLASDCFIDNIASEKFHKSCGFVEMERVICFVKNVGKA